MRLAVIRSANRKPVIIQPNSFKSIDGFMEKKLPYSRTSDQQVQINKRKSDVRVTPTAIMYGYGNTNSQIHIVHSNFKTQTIKIHP